LDRVGLAVIAVLDPRPRFDHKEFAMQRMLGICAAVALCLFAASPASAQCRPGSYRCGSGCAPVGAQCCPNGNYCRAGTVCLQNGRCGIGYGADPGVCASGARCPAGYRCAGNRCIRNTRDNVCDTGAYCPPGQICSEGRCIRRPSFAECERRWQRGECPAICGGRRNNRGVCMGSSSTP
jgi:hypothetical protein